MRSKIRYLVYFSTTISPLRQQLPGGDFCGIYFMHKKDKPKSANETKFLSLRPEKTKL
jgi:hypothetical protein